MNPYARPNAYRENSILTASPEQLVVMLYDGAGRFLRQAEGSMIDGSWLQASEKLSRAEAIIDELLATLDMDAGEVADRLQSIYVFCKTRLIEARIERDRRSRRPGRPPPRRAARGLGAGPLPGGRVSAWDALEALAAEEAQLVADERFDDLAELNAPPRGADRRAPEPAARRGRRAAAQRAGHPARHRHRPAGPPRCHRHRAGPPAPRAHRRAGLRAHVRSPTLNTPALKARAEPPMT